MLRGRRYRDADDLAREMDRPGRSAAPAQFVVDDITSAERSSVDAWHMARVSYSGSVTRVVTLPPALRPGDKAAIAMLSGAAGVRVSAGNGDHITNPITTAIFYAGPGPVYVEFVVVAPRAWMTRVWL